MSAPACQSNGRVSTLRGASALALHADLDQNERDKTLARFRGGSCRVLVATNVASRGLDVAGVGLVVQMEPARDAATSLAYIVQV